MKRMSAEAKFFGMVLLALIVLLLAAFSGINAFGQVTTGGQPPGTVSIRRFGAMGGANDDTAAFQRALNSASAVWVDPPSQGYYTVGNLFLTNNSVLLGANSIIRFKTNATGYMFYGAVNVTNVVLDGLYLDGALYGHNGGGFPGVLPKYTWDFVGPPLGITRSVTMERTAIGMSAATTNGYVTRCTATGFSTHGFQFFGSGQTFPQPEHNLLRLANCVAINCWGGFVFTNSAEYMHPADITTAACGIGLYIQSGNVQITGGQSTKDGVAVYVDGSGINPAHSRVNNRTINHCFIAGQFSGFGNGFVLDGCTFLGGGSILITNCTGVVVQNSMFGTRGTYQAAEGDDIVVDGTGANSGLNFFKNNWLVTTNQPPLIKQVNGGSIVYEDFQVPFVTKITNYTFTATDSKIQINAATKVMTLPTAVGCPGKQYTIKLIAAATTGSVATTSTQNIDGATTYSLSAQYKYVTVQSDGTQWWIIANN